MNAVVDTASTPDARRNPAGTAAWICLAIAWVTFLVPIPGIGLFLGWPLNLVAFILAIVAMSKAGAMKGLFQLLASLIVSPIVYALGMLVLAGTIGVAANAEQAARDAAAAQPSGQVAEEVAVEGDAQPVAE